MVANEAKIEHKACDQSQTKQVYIYESPDHGKTVYRRKFGESTREKIV